MSSYAPTEVGISRVINEDNVAFIFLEGFFFLFLRMFCTCSAEWVSVFAIPFVTYEVWVLLMYGE